MSRYLLLVVLFSCLGVLVLSDEFKHHKKPHDVKKNYDPKSDVEDELARIEEDIARGDQESVDEDEEDEIDMMESDDEAEEEEEREEEVVEYPEDPCLKKHCGPGKECVLTEEGNAKCQCIEECQPENDPRRLVCSNHNDTWNSDCVLYQMRCFCVHDDPRCTSPQKDIHLHVEYYGECREMPECSKFEMEDFPRRMRDWLFNIMRDLSDRQELSEYYMQLERESEQVDQNDRWINAAIWKWCELDGHPRDKKVSRHELFPIRAPLMVLEHCIAPFLDSCDTDDDHSITLTEWGKCIGISDQLLEEKCEDIREAHEDLEQE